MSERKSLMPLCERANHWYDYESPMAQADFFTIVLTGFFPLLFLNILVACPLFIGALILDLVCLPFRYIKKLRGENG